MAERMGFEPMKELLLYTLSKRAPSTTRPPLHYSISKKIQGCSLNFVCFLNQNEAYRSAKYA